MSKESGDDKPCPVAPITPELLEAIPDQFDQRIQRKRRSPSRMDDNNDVSMESDEPRKRQKINERSPSDSASMEVAESSTTPIVENGVNVSMQSNESTKTMRRSERSSSSVSVSQRISIPAGRPLHVPMQNVRIARMHRLDEDRVVLEVYIREKKDGVMVEQLKIATVAEMYAFDAYSTFKFLCEEYKKQLQAGPNSQSNRSGGEEDSNPILTMDYSSADAEPEGEKRNVLVNVDRNKNEKRDAKSAVDDVPMVESTNSHRLK